MLFGLVFFTVVAMAALFSRISHRCLPLPNALGCLGLGTGLAVVAGLVGLVVPTVFRFSSEFLDVLNFPHLFLDGMLALLLFAGALHWDVSGWKDTVLPIALLALFPVVISVFITGGGLFYVSQIIGFPIWWSSALLVAAVTAPTDPVVVITLLKTSGLPKRLFDILTGEALFNDGVAVVAMTVLAQVETAGGNHLFLSALVAFCRLSLLGGLYGFVLGYVMALLCVRISNAWLKVTISLVGVFGGYGLAHVIGVSGPIAMVVAGLVFGARTRSDAGINPALRHVYRFWEVADRWACRILFTILGLEFFRYGILALNELWYVIPLALLCLLSRWVGIGLPLVFLKKYIKPTPNTHMLLTWGGLRGGLPLALAMSLPVAMIGEAAVAAIYGLVLVSVVLQMPILNAKARRSRLPQKA